MKFKIDISNVNPEDVDVLLNELGTTNDQSKTCEKYGAELIPMSNKLIRIGFTGDMTCYLNVTQEEAIERYLRDNPFTTYEDLIKENMVQEFEFDDEFLAYSVYPKNNKNEN